MIARLDTHVAHGWHPGLRGFHRVTLGAEAAVPDTNPTLTPMAALQQAIQMYGGDNLNPAQFQNNAWLSQAADAIQSGAIDTTGGLGPDCSGQAAPNLNLFKTASGLSLSAAAGTEGILASTGVIAATSTAGIALGAATMGVGLIVSVIGMIFQHHAQAVARDLSFGCQAIPAVNNALSVIQQAVASGAATAADAAQSLYEIYAQYMSLGGASGSSSGPGSIPGSGTAINKNPWCNSNCELSVIVLGMCLYWSAQFAQQASEQEAAASAAASMSSSTPTASGEVAATAPLSAQTTATQATGATPTEIQTTETPVASLQTVPTWAWLLAGAVAIYALA